MIADPLPPAANAERLTKALRKSGALPHGGVRRAEVVSSAKKLRSHTLRLRLDYEGLVGHAPDTIILKMGHLDGAGRSLYANPRDSVLSRRCAGVAGTVSAALL